MSPRASRSTIHDYADHADHAARVVTAPVRFYQARISPT